jgi:hypothetical protein
MSDEGKSKELYNLCYELIDDESLLEKVQKWFENNKDNQELLIKAANYIEDNYTSLHFLVRAKPPAELVERLLQKDLNLIINRSSVLFGTILVSTY